MLTPTGVPAKAAPRRRFGHAVSALLHALLLLLLVLVSLTREPPPDAQEIAVEFLEELPASADVSLPAASHDARGAFAPSMLAIDDLRIEIDRIRDRSSMLFPFLTLDLMFLATLPQQTALARSRLTNPFAAASEGLQPPLEIDDAALQAKVDAAWSRRHRWQAFEPIATLVASHDSHRGRVADVVRAYLDQNMLQPYCDGVARDPRFWAMLENAADHVDFIDFVRNYSRDHPSSRTTTELLFLLDELAQGSRDVLLLLLETQPERDLAQTHATSPDAYALAGELKQRYGRWLFERGLDRHALRAFYDELRLRLLRTILETTPDGYRAADARYLAGEVLFGLGRRLEAYRMWRGISPRRSDAYFRAYSEVLDAVLTTKAIDVLAVHRAIEREYGRWRVYSIDRLRQFGHSCDTF